LSLFAVTTIGPAFGELLGTLGPFPGQKPSLAIRFTLGSRGAAPDSSPITLPHGAGCRVPVPGGMPRSRWPGR